MRRPRPTRPSARRTQCTCGPRSRRSAGGTCSCRTWDPLRAQLADPAARLLPPLAVVDPPHRGSAASCSSSRSRTSCAASRSCSAATRCSCRGGTTDPATLPTRTTWSLLTNLPHPKAPAGTPGLPAGRPGRGGAPVQPAHLGGAGRQAGQGGAWLGRGPGPKRPGDPAALAAGLLRVLVLLAGVVCRAGRGSVATGCPARLGGRAGGCSCCSFTRRRFRTHAARSSARGWTRLSMWVIGRWCTRWIPASYSSAPRPTRRGSCPDRRYPARGSRRRGS